MSQPVTYSDALRVFLATIAIIVVWSWVVLSAISDAKGDGRLSRWRWYMKISSKEDSMVEIKKEGFMSGHNTKARSAFPPRDERIEPWLAPILEGD